MARTARQKAALKKAQTASARKRRRFGKKSMVAAAAVGYAVYNRRKNKNKPDTKPQGSRTPVKVSDASLRRAKRDAKKAVRKQKKVNVKTKSRGLRAVRRLSRGRR